MRLKKIEMSGFKSFLNKTKIIFPEGISAVVGPNGCGKSNIVDALRWVMGEQSVKQLRGQSREDIIFAGADGKKPVNMAEVSLLVENSPSLVSEVYHDFTEIMITRRLYRSGESVYLLNRQPCRLKDIHDLFLGSGTGKNAFAVIQQGNIGAITDATPEERRIFIEEAADITKYKNRKKETLTRIASTKENLIRISDITIELKRQITALERQAKKAQLFKTYRKKIKHLDISIALYRFEQLTEAISDHQHTLEVLEQKEKENAVTLGQYEGDYSAARVELLEQKHAIEALKTTHYETQRDIDKNENDTGHCEINLEAIEREIAQYHRELEEIKEKNKELENEMFQVQSNSTGVKKDLVQVDNDLVTVSTDLEAMKINRTTIDENIKKLNVNHMRLEAERAKHRSVLNNAESRKETIDRRIKIADEDVVTSRKNRDNYLKKKETLVQQRDEIASFCMENRKCLEEKKQELKAYSKLLDRLHNDLKNDEIEFGRKNSEYLTLKSMHDNYEWYENSVKVLMDEFNTGNPHVATILGDIITPLDGYEKAVEAAIGEALQYLIVDSVDQGLEMISFLDSGNKGRCGFIINNRTKNDSFSASSITQYISCDKDYSSAVGRLFGNIDYVDTLEEAIEISIKEPVHPVLVTGNGEVVTPLGVLKGGNTKNKASLFKKKQDLYNLDLSVKKISKHNRELQEAIQKQEAEMNGVSSDAESIQNELMDATTELTEKEKQLYMIEKDLEHQKRNLAIVELETERLEGEKDDIDVEIEESLTKCQTLDADIHLSEKAITETVETVSTVTSTLERHNSQYMDLKLRHNSMKNRKENLDATLSRLRDFLKEGRTRCEKLEQDIQLRYENRQHLIETVTNNHNNLNDLSELLETINKGMEEAECLYKNTESKLDQIEKKISRLKKKGETFADEINKERLSMIEHQSKREALTSRIEEKYHHKINQYLLEFEENENHDIPESEIELVGCETEMEDLKVRLKRLGEVNTAAISEFQELKTRYDFMVKQQEDLNASLEDLVAIIDRINTVSQKRFMETFHAINKNLGDLFAKLFEGGVAELVLTNPAEQLETGVEMMIQPPGKTLTRLSLLSGGEKALSAIAFLFSVFLIKPSSFCILDEIDAPLDDANVIRFNNLLKVIGEKSQILIITHNKLTMEFANILFGVTMEKKGVSKVVSVELTEEVTYEEREEVATPV